MDLTYIVAATDESEAGRQAVRTALELAANAGARVTVMRAVQVSGAVLAGMTEALPTAEELGAPGVERLQRWVEADLPALERMPSINYAIAFGIPGVEITRFAEHEGADLLVLGRKPRSRMARLLLGDTADAVARRSRLPCLFVPPSGTLPREVLVAIDGSHRGMAVLTAGGDFARLVGARLRVLTVEAAPPGERDPLDMATPVARTMYIRSQVQSAVGYDVEVRRGEPADQILAAVDERPPDVLVVGCHRGGPAGIIEAGSTARRVAHTAPCAVLTVPL
jgi:nucleotide-binding universal stress UspA family protein